jgi:hypothetical protein
MRARGDPSRILDHIGEEQPTQIDQRPDRPESADAQGKKTPPVSAPLELMRRMVPRKGAA